MIAAVFVVHWKYKRPFPQIILWCGIFILVYGSFLLFSISFIDTHTPVDLRILFPVFVLSLICMVSALAAVLPHIKNIPFVRVLPLAVCLSYLILNLFASAPDLKWVLANGQGYTNQLWLQSELMEEAFLLADGVPLYSNGPDAIYFARNETAVGIPVKIFATSEQANENYEADFAAMLISMEQQHAKIVYFNEIDRWYLPTQEELLQKAPLRIIFENEEGAVYAYSGSSSD